MEFSAVFADVLFRRNSFEARLRYMFRSQTTPGPVRVGAHMGPYGPLWAHIWAHMDRSWRFRQLSVNFPEDIWTNFARFGSKNGILTKFIDCCMAFGGEAKKTHYFYKKSSYLTKNKKYFKSPKKYVKFLGFLGFPVALWSLVETPVETPSSYRCRW